VTLLVSRLDTLVQRLDRVGIFPALGRSLGLVRVYAIRKTCSVQGHISVECHNGPFIIKHTNGLHSFNPSP